jgi:hypothetical protein
MTWDTTVFNWWILMSGIGAVNILLWLYLVKKQSMNPWLFSGGLYVLGCASRSFIPRSDIDRVVMFDTFASSIFVGRTIATIAELGFVAQWAIVLWQFGKAAQNGRIKAISQIIFPLIFIAEIFSWYASITTNTVGSVFEETLWGVVFALITYCVFIARHALIPSLQPWALAAVAGLSLYVVYMFTIDVPFYYSKWQANLASGKTFDSLHEGVHKMLTQWRVSRLDKDWQYEFLWQGLYFSFGVWASLLLNLVPPRLKQIVASKS